MFFPGRNELDSDHLNADHYELSMNITLSTSLL